MNRLNPQLKQLLQAVGKIERTSDATFEPPPRDFVLRVLREIAPSSGVRPPSLLEFMVPRAAFAAALAGIVILAVQISATGSSIGMLKDVTAPCAALFRLFLS